MVSGQSKKSARNRKSFSVNSEAILMCSLETRYTHAIVSLRTSRLHGPTSEWGCYPSAHKKRG